MSSSGINLKESHVENPTWLRKYMLIFGVAFWKLEFVRLFTYESSWWFYPSKIYSDLICGFTLPPDTLAKPSLSGFVFSCGQSQPCVFLCARRFWLAVQFRCLYKIYCDQSGTLSNALEKTIRGHKKCLANMFSCSVIIAMSKQRHE